MKNTRQNLRMSILDRLVDHEPGRTRESVQNHLVTVPQIKKSVLRDLENLLNTRRHIFTPHHTYREVGQSLFVYGLGDFSTKNPNSPFIRQHLRQDVEKTIKLFEPRLKNVSVRVDEAVDRSKKHLHFKINALLVIDPISESVNFDTFFDIKRGEYRISE